MFGGALLSEGLDPKIREQMVRGFSITEPKNSSCNSAVLNLTSFPEPYLSSIVEDPNLRLYVKLNALSCLGEIQSPTSRERLEGICLHPNQHPMLRRSAIHSYIKQIPKSERSNVDPSFGGRLREREYLEYVKQVVLRETNDSKIQEKKATPTSSKRISNQEQRPSLELKRENPIRR